MIRVTTWQRLRHWLAGFWSTTRPATPAEAALLDRVSDLEAQLAAAHGVAEELRQEAKLAEVAFDLERRKLKADVEACRHEVQLLSDIHERDRKRVEADTAVLASQIAEATAQHRDAR